MIAISTVAPNDDRPWHALPPAGHTSTDSLLLLGFTIPHPLLRLPLPLPTRLPQPCQLFLVGIGIMVVSIVLVIVPISLKVRCGCYQSRCLSMRQDVAYLVQVVRPHPRHVRCSSHL